MNYLQALQAKSLGSLAVLRGQSFGGFTGVMAAALAANATVFAVRYPAAATGRFVLAAMHLHFTCLASFTAPITAARRLALRRGSGGDPSTGTAIDVMRDTSSSTETLLTGQVATTTGLTVTGVTYETPSRARLMLSHVGTAGLDYDEIWAPETPLLVLLPGELAGIVAPAAFDAGGTWQLSVKAFGFEVP